MRGAKKPYGWLLRHMTMVSAAVQSASMPGDAFVARRQHKTARLGQKPSATSNDQLLRVIFACSAA